MPEILNPYNPRARKNPEDAYADHFSDSKIANNAAKEIFDHYKKTKELDSENPPTRKDVILKLISAFEIKNQEWLHGPNIQVELVSSEGQNVLIVKFLPEGKNKEKDEDIKKLVINFAVGEKESELLLHGIQKKIKDNQIARPEVVFGLSHTTYNDVCGIVSKHGTSKKTVEELERSPVKNKFINEITMQLKNSISAFAINAIKEIDKNLTFKNKTSREIKERIVDLHKNLILAIKDMVSISANAANLEEKNNDSENTEKINQILAEYLHYLTNIPDPHQRTATKVAIIKALNHIREYYEILDNINQEKTESFNPKASKTVKQLVKPFREVEGFIKSNYRI